MLRAFAFFALTVSATNSSTDPDATTTTAAATTLAPTTLAPTTLAAVATTLAAVATTLQPTAGTATTLQPAAVTPSPAVVTADPTPDPNAGAAAKAIEDANKNATAETNYVKQVTAFVTEFEHAGTLETFCTALDDKATVDAAVKAFVGICNDASGAQGALALGVSEVTKTPVKTAGCAAVVRRRGLGKASVKDEYTALQIVTETRTAEDLKAGAAKVKTYVETDANKAAMLTTLGTAVNGALPAASQIDLTKSAIKSVAASAPVLSDKDGKAKSTGAASGSTSIEVAGAMVAAFASVALF